MLEDAQCGALNLVPNVIAVTNELITPDITALAMAFPANTMRVKLFIAHHKPQSIQLSVLSLQKRKKTEVAQLGYAAAAFVGPFCLHHFVAFSRTGAVLDDSGPMHC